MKDYQKIIMARLDFDWSKGRIMWRSNMQISPEERVGSGEELADCGLLAASGRHLFLSETRPHPLPGSPLAAFAARIWVLAAEIVWLQSLKYFLFCV